MKNDRLQRFFIGFAAAIILVLLVAVVSFYTLEQQSEEEIMVEHTHKVLNRVEGIGRLLVDMETGRRGFRCTNDRQFLEPYYKSQPRIAGALDELQQLVIDNPAQTAKVKQLATDVLKLDAFWRGINIDIVYVDVQQKVAVTKTEKTLMDIIRGDVDAINAAEDLLLLNRQKLSHNGLDRARWTIGIGIFLILLVVFNLIRQVIAAFKSRMIAENALKDQIVEVEKINADIHETNWLLTGIREINGSLIGSDSLRQLAQSCMGCIADYMGVPAGAFYFFNKDQQRLSLIGSIALPAGAAEAIQLNEGIPGHAAMSKEPTVITDLPANYWKITSAAGAAVPDAIICLPLWQKNELKGLIEIACFTKEVGRYKELLAAVATNIAIAVNGAYSNEAMAKLLLQVQDQKEELESQQEELRQTNEELVHQSDVLRASEEELRTQEEELRQINVELEEKTEVVEQARVELSRKAVELEASSKYKSEFLANMSHELRTPLNSVLILAALLKDNKTKNLSDKQIDYARIIHKSGSDLLDLINDILDLSKIEAGKVDVFFEDVRVKEIANDMEQLFTVLAQQKKIGFAVNIGTQVPEYISTDKQRLEQVLKNLLSNAFKFTPEQGSISLDVKVNKADLEISVTDSGIGISAEKQQLIFEAFQQADGSTSRKYGGTGLGLSISKELVKRLHGRMVLTSDGGKGSTFTVIFPLQYADDILLERKNAPQDAAAPVITFAAESVKEQTAIKDDKTALETGDQPILIIEDDLVFAQHVNDFAHGKGYKTIIANSGDEGILYARKYQPAAIILDLGLPVIDGRSVLKILKSEESLKYIPVHLVTAEDRGSVPLGDVDSYFQKPLNDNELEQTFNNIGRYITGKYKDILVLSAADSTLRHMFSKLTETKNVGVMYTMVDSPEHAIAAIKDKNYDCIIADIGSDMQYGIDTLHELKSAERNEAYMITCLEGDVSPADEKKLKKYSDSIIRKSSHATSRLMDEVELFLHKIKSVKAIAVPARFDKDFDKTLNGKKVLLADDDMRNVFALTALLEEQEMEVLTAENGKEALDVLANNEDVNIVLMDIMMPEMDGYETIQHIRAQKKHGKLPIIALTAKAMTGDREKCLEAGASDYITKPIDSNKLFSLMRVWLAQ